MRIAITVIVVLLPLRVGARAFGAGRLGRGSRGPRTLATCAARRRAAHLATAAAIAAIGRATGRRECIRAEVAAPGRGRRGGRRRGAHALARRLAAVRVLRRARIATSRSKQNDDDGGWRGTRIQQRKKKKEKKKKEEERRRRKKKGMAGRVSATAGMHAVAPRTQRTELLLRCSAIPGLSACCSCRELDDREAGRKKEKISGAGAGAGGFMRCHARGHC